MADFLGRNMARMELAGHRGRTVTNTLKQYRPALSLVARPGRPVPSENLKSDQLTTKTSRRFCAQESSDEPSTAGRSLP